MNVPVESPAGGITVPANTNDSSVNSRSVDNDSVNDDSANDVSSRRNNNSSVRNDAELVAREPWPAEGIKSNSRIEDYRWGYLLQYSNGRFEFDTSTRPSDEEIMQRWWFYIHQT